VGQKAKIVRKSTGFTLTRKTTLRVSHKPEGPGGKKREGKGKKHTHLRLFDEKRNSAI